MLGAWTYEAYSLFLVLLAPTIGSAQVPGCPTAGKSTHFFWTDYLNVPGTLILNGDGVHIKAGHKVYLNTTPTTPLKFLWVEGDLVFDACHGVMDLPVAAILVDDGGSFQIGTGLYPYSIDASVTLSVGADPPTAPELSNLGIDSSLHAPLMDRGFVVAGGALRLFGADRGGTWEKIDATVTAGSTTLSTIAPTSFTPVVGDEVLLTPTDFDFLEGEVAEFTSVSPTYNLASALSNTHYADSIPQEFKPAGAPPGTDWQVSEQGEIALLERNIVIRSEEDPLDADSFGHVLVLNHPVSQNQPVFRIEWAAFEDLGDYDVGGRYPLHIHEVGDLEGATPTRFIRSALIRDARHHGIVIHNTHGIEVTDNVVHNVAGYGIYLQQESMHNTIERNLVHGGGLAGECCFVPGDVYAGFNIKRPDNIVNDNVATGFHDYGFYLVPADGASYPLNVGSPPFYTFESSFKGNEVHSVSGIGFFQNTNAATDDVLYEELFAWKCREYGAWIRSLESYDIVDSVFADCRSGFYPASTGIRNAGDGDQLIENCLFVGVTANFSGDHAQETANFPNHDLQWDVLSGVEIYDGLVEVTNCRFAEFEDALMSSGTTYPDDYRLAAGLSQVAKFTTWSIDPRNTVNSLTFENVDRTVYFRDPLPGENQTAFTVINDTDNSLGYGTDVRLFPNVDFLSYSSGGTLHIDSQSLPNLNGWSAPLPTPSSGDSWGQIVFAPITGGQFGGAAKPLITIERIDGSSGPPTASGSPWESETVPISPQEGGNEEPRYPINLAVQRASDVGPGGTLMYYQIEYDQATWQGNVPDEVDIDLRFTESKNDVVILELPYPSAGVGQTIDVSVFGQGLTMANDLSALLGDYGTVSGWFHNSSSETMYVRIVAALAPSHTVALEGTQTFLTIETP